MSAPDPALLGRVERILNLVMVGLLGLSGVTEDYRRSRLRSLTIRWGNGISPEQRQGCVRADIRPMGITTFRTVVCRVTFLAEVI